MPCRGLLGCCGWAPSLFPGVVAGGESVVPRAEALPRQSEFLGDSCWRLALPAFAALFATVAACFCAGGVTFGGERTAWGLATFWMFTFATAGDFFLPWRSRAPLDLLCMFSKLY